MFTILRVAGKQYNVSAGDLIDVDHMDGNEGDTVTLDDVLLVEKDGNVSVGMPTVKGVKAKAKIVKQYKGEKIEVRRFKSKVRYRRKRGFRPHRTQLEIVSVGA